MSSYSIVIELSTKFLILQRELVKNWSPELQAHDTLTPEMLNLIAAGERIETFEVDQRALKNLETKEKITLWIYLNLIRSLDLPLQDISVYWLDSLISKLKTLLTGSDLVSTISLLSRQRFILWFEEFITSENNRRIFFQNLYGKNWNRKGLSLFDLLLSGKLFLHHRIKTPSTPKKKQFRKGYRDHGSLGSEIARIRQEEEKDIWIQDSLQRKKKEQEDLLRLIEGWID